MRNRGFAALLALGVVIGLAVLIRPRNEAGLARPPAPLPGTGIADAPPPAASATAPRRVPRSVGSSRIPDLAAEPEASFSFDDRSPLIDQVRPMLDAVDFDSGYVLAWRSRPQEVADAVIALLKDPALDSNQREMGLAILQDLKLPTSVPAILETARRDEDEDTRTHAIRILASFKGHVSEQDVRGLFGNAKSADEKTETVMVLGELGDAASLPFLEKTAKAYPDKDVVDSADLAIQMIRIESSPKPEVGLVQILHQTDHPLREWAATRIASRKQPELAHHLREVLEILRKQPQERADRSYQYYLLRGLQDLGQELSPAERKFVRNYGSSQPEE